MSEELVMKLISFSRDSDVELVINPANPGTYDLSFSGDDGISIESGLTASEAWLRIRMTSTKVPAKLMLDFAELAIASSLKSKDTYNVTLNPEVTDAE
jgi:hypothetical protein